MKTKLMCLLLAVLMLSSGLLFACGSEEAKPTGEGSGATVGEGDSTDPAEVYDAEIKNLNGHEFRFFVEDFAAESWKTKEVFAEAPNGDKVNDAVFQRNARIAQTYNCTISQETYVAIDAGAVLKDSLLAGEYVCDFIYAKSTNLLSLASSRLLTDMGALDNMDLTKVWWDQSIVKHMNIGGKVFFLSGSAGISDDLSSWACCFNKEFVREYDAELDLYQTARNGEWTVDLMYDIMSNTWRDTNGDGVMTAGRDRFGWVGAYQDNYFMLLAGGLTLGNYSSNGDISIPDQPKPEILDGWSKLRPLLTSPYREVSDMPSRVREGQATFCTAAVSPVIMKAGLTKVAMGLLPIPKLNETQDKYYTGVYYGMVLVYCIPDTVENSTDWQTNGFSSGAEQCAYFLEAFSYYSHLILRPAFYEQVVLKQNATDEESAEMVELCLQNKMFDPVAGFRWGNLVNAFYGCGSSPNYQPNTDINYDNLVSTYIARVNSTRKAVEGYIEAINAEEVS